MQESNDPKQILFQAFGAQGVELFGNLLHQKPQKADAIVFLQGDRFDRALKVVSLYDQQYANQILVVGNNVLIGKGKRPDEDNVSLEEMVEYLVAHAIPRERILVKERTENLLNTLGQATDTIWFAKEKQWNTVLIVVSPYHLLRSFLTFAKQAKEQAWRGTMIFQVADLPWDKPPSGRTKTALEVFRTELEKIRAYQKDLLTIEEGMVFKQSAQEACLVRKVRQEDSRRVWEIRNSPLVRQLSSSQDLVPFETHVVWFEKTYFSGQKNVCVVIECRGEVVGYCRFDFDDKKNAYNVSIAIDPAYHGKGLGHQLLSGSLLGIPQTSIVNAAVKKRNTTSVALFKKNNFTMTNEDEQYYYFSFLRKVS